MITELRIEECSECSDLNIQYRLNELNDQLDTDSKMLSHLL